MEQLKCKLCKSKRELTEDEINISKQIISERNLKPDAIRDIWNIYDGEKCPQGGYHKYDWNGEFFQKMLDESAKIKDSEVEIIKNNNENKELENSIEQLKIDTENKIKEMQKKIEENKEKNKQQEQSNIESMDNILKTSGREWKLWL